ncbi:hypothetical protein ACIOHS_24515 [Streptomyces sp. NPDC088253]|uniref:hypothetical protein n=1 Tax=Streptomyces sp. NPDC088253 TaxID=3365846 RepID=UPI00380D32A0
MKELTLRLDPALAQALDDLADAQDRLPEEVAEDAVRRYLHDEGAQVRALAARLAQEHAELLRRLGE